MSLATENDNESLSAATPATINVPGKSLSLIHVRETVRDKIFPRAKFLRLEDLEYSQKKIHGVKKWQRGAALSLKNCTSGGGRQRKLIFKNWH